MVSVAMCKQCGKINNINYKYCPWCGALQNDYHNDTHIETVFSILEEKQNDIQLQEISEMEKQLDELDRELSIIEVGLGIHK